MRVALLCPYALSVHGGAQEQVLAMSRELAARETTLLVLAPDGADTAHYDTPARVLTIGRRALVPANGSRAPITLSPHAPHLARRALATFAPDVVHVHEPVAPLLGYGVLRAHEYPIVGTFHRGGGGPAYTLTRPLLRRLVRGIDRPVAVSEAAARTIEDAVGVRARVLFNGLETERFRAFPREHTTPPTVLFVGRLEHRKGAETLVRAARLAGGRWRTVIVGDGGDRAALEAAAPPTVTFVGAVDDEEKRRWLRRADVVVAPSLGGESFGLVVLEPMAAEVRVVASRIDGYVEAAGGCATLFTPGDADALASAIVTALARDDEAVARARAHAEAWSMSALVDRYEEEYAAAREQFSRAT